jgi:hypothetical protein
MKQYQLLLLLLANTFCLSIKNIDGKSNLKENEYIQIPQAKLNNYSTSIYQTNNQNIIINASLLRDNENELLKEYILHYNRLFNTFEKYHKLLGNPIQNHSFPERLTELADKKLFPVKVIKRHSNISYGKKESNYIEDLTNLRNANYDNQRNSEYYSDLESQQVQNPYQLRQTYSSQIPM